MDLVCVCVCFRRSQEHKYLQNTIKATREKLFERERESEREK